MGLMIAVKHEGRKPVGTMAPRHANLSVGAMLQSWARFWREKKLAQPFLKDSFKVSRFDIINIYYLDKENWYCEYQLVFFSKDIPILCQSDKKNMHFFAWNINMLFLPTMKAV